MWLFRRGQAWLSPASIDGRAFTIVPKALYDKRQQNTPVWTNIFVRSG
jgi:hypothetical protein